MESDCRRECKTRHLSCDLLQLSQNTTYKIQIFENKGEINEKGTGLREKNLPVEKAPVNTPPKVDMATAKGMMKAKGPRR